ncbi:S1 family peptidase [Nocardiopsis composta]|uniref:Streptogrisin C n=1 Tax=Nocardiopsis composta TaxID=157465 RepID=A0A7W8QKI5_9ACTN|nr:S1 family peptidase [Nocardiopsis composta]MBB5431493.1 streptogrisin C [Nocardiopsis composta]
MPNIPRRTWAALRSFTVRSVLLPLAVLAAALAAAPPAAAGTGDGADAQIIAGDPFVNDDRPGTRCTIGVAVTVGFLADAGCGSAGDRIRGADGGTGQVAWSSPAEGVLLVAADPGWTPTALLRSGSGTAVVEGTDEAPVGATVCRTGASTGRHCGTILAKDQTVTTPEGTVTGLTRTGICAEPGDRGGVYYATGHVQGVFFAGSGNCATGGASFFHPVLPILSAHGLTAVTG